MKEYIRFCRRCGKYTRNLEAEECPRCLGFLYEDEVDIDCKENYFSGEEGKVYSVEDLKASYDEDAEKWKSNFDVASFEECLDIMTDMGGDLSPIEFEEEF